MTRDRLSSILRGKVVIVGIGNVLKGDDGLGPALLQRLAGKIPAVCIDAGVAPENYTRKIQQADPDTILFVDAVHLGLQPGESQVLEKDDILKSGMTTHDLSPAMFIEYLQQQVKAGIYLLGVQPQNLTLGQGLSPAVAVSLENIAATIEEVLHA